MEKLSQRQPSGQEKKTRRTQPSTIFDPRLGVLVDKKTGQPVSNTKPGQEWSGH